MMNNVPQNISTETRQKLQLFFITITMLGLNYSTKLIKTNSNAPYLGVSISMNKNIDLRLQFIFNKKKSSLLEDKAQLWFYNTGIGFTGPITKGYKTFDEIINDTIQELSKTQEAI